MARRMDDLNISTEKAGQRWTSFAPPKPTPAEAKPSGVLSEAPPEGGPSTVAPPEPVLTEAKPPGDPFEAPPEEGPPTVLDMIGFVESMRLFACKQYITSKAPKTDATVIADKGHMEKRVELCTIFWARCTDRTLAWTDVVQQLGPEEQIMLAQRLGYFNIFNVKRPAMRYHLRMYRMDEHEMAWRIFHMSLAAPHLSIVNGYLNGNPKKFHQSDMLWKLWRGNCGTQGTEVPKTTIEFDLEWPEADKGETPALIAMRKALQGGPTKARSGADRQRQGVGQQEKVRHEWTEADKGETRALMAIQGGPTKAVQKLAKGMHSNQGAEKPEGQLTQVMVPQEVAVDAGIRYQVYGQEMKSLPVCTKARFKPVASPLQGSYKQACSLIAKDAVSKQLQSFSKISEAKN
eukprot:gene23461-17287_t